MDELQQIQQQIADLQKKAQELQQQKKSEIIDEVKAKIKAYGLTAKECGFGATEKATEDKKSQPVAIKYKHGENTWTGRGMKPKWIVKYLEDGGKLEELLVK